MPAPDQGGSRFKPDLRSAVKKQIPFVRKKSFWGPKPGPKDRFDEECGSNFEALPSETSERQSDAALERQLDATLKTKILAPSTWIIPLHHPPPHQVVHRLRRMIGRDGGPIWGGIWGVGGLIRIVCLVPKGLVVWAERPGRPSRAGWVNRIEFCRVLRTTQCGA